MQVTAKRDDSHQSYTGFSLTQDLTRLPKRVT